MRRTPGTVGRWTTLIAFATAVGAVATIAQAAEERWSRAVEEEAARNAAVSQVLEGVDSELTLRRVTKDPPRHCARVPSHGKWCTWSLGRTSPGWKPLVEALGFGGKRVSLVVAYAEDQSGRISFKGAWSTNSRFSPWYLSPPSSKRKGMSGRKQLREQRAARQAAAKPVFEATASLPEAVTMAGQGPDICETRTGGIRCLWTLKRTSWGHALAAATLDDDAQIEMICSFAADGSAIARPACALRAL